MHVITRKRLNEFTDKHPDTKSALARWYARWYALMRKGRFSNFVQLREVFPQANRARLIAAIHYNRNKIYIRHVLIHQEYDAGKWKD
jgi:mRNA interferase HigB